jgi:tetratricopeptide (TPR) repeat protein
MKTVSSPQALFSAAEQAYVGGRLGDARANLLRLEQIGVKHPAVDHLRAIVERGLGNVGVARRYFEAAQRLAPNDPQIANNLGNLLADLGNDPEALRAYERALSLNPSFAEAMFNRALLLERVGRTEEARTAYWSLVTLEPRDARFWCGLGALEKEEGNLQAAADAFDQALALESENVLAANGRARVALERSERDVRSHYRAARRLSPRDRQLIFEEAEARLAEGDRAALDDFAEAVQEAPDWTFGQIALARMLHASEEANRFADHVEALLHKDPSRSDLWIEYIQMLGAAGLPAEASEAAHRARTALGDSAWLALTEAGYAGQAGDLDRAEALLAALPVGVPGRAIQDCLHQIRRGNIDSALLHIDHVLEEDRLSVSAWTLAELVYRKAGDPRSQWLSGQEGLIRSIDLPLDAAAFAAVDALLLALHANGAELLGQSVRAGTQTRWQLFDRPEPEIAPLRRALTEAVAAYMATLPPADPDHPLLRYKDAPTRISGSWSVRLTGSGHHVPHFHPNGIVSSACYFRVPACTENEEGWLELGRPPADLLLELEPLTKIAPRPGRLVLFPSFLYHGTRPFGTGERMSVAFDVTPGRRSPGA